MTGPRVRQFSSSVGAGQTAWTSLASLSSQVLPVRSTEICGARSETSSRLPNVRSYSVATLRRTKPGQGNLGTIQSACPNRPHLLGRAIASPGHPLQLRRQQSTASGTPYPSSRRHLPLSCASYRNMSSSSSSPKPSAQEPAVPLLLVGRAQNPPHTNPMAHHPRIPVFRTLQELRSWRKRAREMKLEVGVVPTVSVYY
jgi:hypothetical protein